jgi:hypothetical protein
MVLKTIPVTSIGTGMTLVYTVSAGRTARIQNLIITNSASAVRTVNIWDSSSSTSGVVQISKVIVPANSTYTFPVILNKEVKYGYITAICNEGTETTIEGVVEEV